jgi:1,4-dihydroxy-2-naphthoate polyprenyltransferase
LVSNLLLLNQFPDVDADNSIKRKNFPIVIGRRASSIIYVVFLIFAYLTIILGVSWQFLPKLCLIGIITCLFAVPSGIGAFRYADRIDKLITYMGANVVINISTPILVAIGLLL